MPPGVAVGHACSVRNRTAMLTRITRSRFNRDVVRVVRGQPAVRERAVEVRRPHELGQLVGQAAWAVEGAVPGRALHLDDLPVGVDGRRAQLVFGVGRSAADASLPERLQDIHLCRPVDRQAVVQGGGRGRGAGRKAQAGEEKGLQRRSAVRLARAGVQAAQVGGAVRDARRFVGSLPAQPSRRRRAGVAHPAGDRLLVAAELREGPRVGAARRADPRADGPAVPEGGRGGCRHGRPAQPVRPHAGHGRRDAPIQRGRVGRREARGDGHPGAGGDRPDRVRAPAERHGGEGGGAERRDVR